MHNLIGLNFYLKETHSPYAARMWPAVPRVGEVVMLHDVARDAGDRDLRRPALVLLIAWGRREKTWAGEMLECDVWFDWDDEIGIPSKEEVKALAKPALRFGAADA